MHIAIFLDQHPDSLGGAQASVRLQTKFLIRAGHRVTICSPQANFGPVSGVLTYPSLPLTKDGDFGFTLRVGHAVKLLKQKFAAIDEPIDVVHVQADNWGAAIGIRFAKENDLPLVHHLHTNLEHGLNKIVGKPLAKVAVWGLSAGFWAMAKVSGSKVTSNAWSYLRQLASQADLVLAPSNHFAKLAKEHQVAKEIVVIPTGVDDVFVTKQSKKAKKDSQPGSLVKFIWCGRVSHEKRILVFLEAIKLAKVDAKFDVWGTGGQLDAAKKYVAENELSHQVSFFGHTTHQNMVSEIGKADVLVQTSVGFETQGMTVFEAGVMQTPAIICDRNIATELPKDSFWQVADESAEALAAAIREAFKDISQSKAKKIDLRAHYLQSRLCETMVGYYKEAVKRHRERQ